MVYSAFMACISLCYLLDHSKKFKEDQEYAEIKVSSDKGYSDYEDENEPNETTKFDKEIDVEPAKSDYETDNHDKHDNKNESFATHEVGDSSGESSELNNVTNEMKKVLEDESDSKKTDGEVLSVWKYLTSNVYM